MSWLASPLHSLAADHLVLVKSMIRQAGAILLCLGQLYIAGLWVYAAARIRFSFAWLFALSALLYLLLSAVNLAFAFGWSQLQQVLGAQFMPVFNALLVAQPIALFIGAVAHTVLVTWLLRVCPRTQPGAGADHEQPL